MFVFVVVVVFVCLLFGWFNVQRSTFNVQCPGSLENLADLNGKAPGNVGLKKLPGGGTLSPLVYQSGGISSTPGAQTSIDKYPANTTILEQPVDFSTLAPKYREFVVDFIDKSSSGQYNRYNPPAFRQLERIL